MVLAEPPVSTFGPEMTEKSTLTPDSGTPSRVTVAVALASDPTVPEPVAGESATSSGAIGAVTVSTSSPQVVDDGLFNESPL